MLLKRLAVASSTHSKGALVLLTLGLFLALLLSPLTAQAQAREDQIRGQWKNDERGLVVKISKDNDGRWSGVVVEATHSADVGKMVFQKLCFRPVQGDYVGGMVKPDDDEKLSVTLVLASATKLEAVAQKFIFKKTLVFTRQNEAPAGQSPSPLPSRKG